MITWRTHNMGVYATLNNIQTTNFELADKLSELLESQKLD